MEKEDGSAPRRLIGVRHEVPGLGAVELLDVMGSDAAICDAARRTIRKARKLSEDRDLIRYMLRHHHGTPFEMCVVKLMVEMPLVFKNQMIRHRAASLLDDTSMWDEPSVNEFSGRYSEFPEAFYATPPDGWRLQSPNNRQGSGGYLGVETRYNAFDPESETGDSTTVGGDHLSREEAQFLTRAREIYEDRLAAGVAREQARKDLPVSQVTQFVWCCDLRNVLHFLALRMDSHAQQEIREYATIIGRKIIAPLFPLVFDAFETYQLHALTLSALDIIVARDVTRGAPFEQACKLAGLTNRREVAECRAKLARLGLIEDKPEPEPLP
jgi:thymidylate synthase (FAD)